MLAMEAALAGDEVWIAARTPEKAADLCADVERALESGPPSPAPVRTRGVGLADLPGLVASGVRFNLLLQATPVGMWPDIAGLPVPVGVLDGVDAVFDTIYNPLATRLVLAARRRGLPASGGLGMLVEQAAVSFRLWNPDLPDPLPRGGEGRSILDRRLRTALLARSPFNLVLTGFMGSGKSTVGKVLARELDADFVDLDALVEARTGQTVPEIFAERGEAEFRRLEQEALRSLDEPRRLRVVATGGGALLTPESAARVHDGRGLVVLLDASIHAILKRVGSGEGRPLLSGPGAEERARELMLKRRPAYLAAADAVVMAGRPAKQVARSVRMALGLEDGPSQGGTR
jgi:shikimate dehydrogenase